MYLPYFKILIFCNIIFKCQFSLQVDNSKSVLHKIANLYAEQLMSDLVLEVGGVGYPSHRLILCASSEVFQVSSNLELEV